MVYIITYKINPLSKDYSALYQQIKSLGEWMRYIDDSWFLEPRSLKNAEAIYDRLIPFIDGENDYLFVAKITSKDNNGWLPKDAWKWLRERDL